MKLLWVASLLSNIVTNDPDPFRPEPLPNAPDDSPAPSDAINLDSTRTGLPLCCKDGLSHLLRLVGPQPPTTIGHRSPALTYDCLITFLAGGDVNTKLYRLQSVRRIFIKYSLRTNTGKRTDPLNEVPWDNNALSALRRELASNTNDIWGRFLPTPFNCHSLRPRWREEAFSYPRR